MSSFAYRRRHEEEDDGVDAKRRRGPAEFNDVEKRLQDVIAHVGDKGGGASLESNLESLCTVLEADLDKYRSTIIDIIATCVSDLPEKVAVYSTLVGLLNAKNFNFGGEIIEKIIGDLQDCFETENFRKALYLVIFLCDLGNTKVVTWSSVVEFLEGFIQQAYEEDIPQVRSDWFVYLVLHSLPWIGNELNEKRREQLDNILEGCQKHIDSRQKSYVSLLKVWLSDTPHDQEEYLDSLWAQITTLKAADWKEKQVKRPYLAFDAALQDALQHNLPNFSAPSHREDSSYPLPSVIFRLFDYADCPEDGTVLPGAHSIERFLIEQELFWILHHSSFNRRYCAEQLIELGKDLNVPVLYMILEVVFADLFKLPSAPLPGIFYGSLLIELCKLQPNTMPQVLAQAAELLYQRSSGMQPICIDRLIDWFSYHLSNFQYQWTWDDWGDCLQNDVNTFNAKLFFVREVLEKCMRFSYYDKLHEIVPVKFGRILPAKPDIRYTLDDESEPGFELAKKMRQLFESRATDDSILSELKGNDGEYDPHSFSVFFATMLMLARKSFSHNFAALTRYIKTLKEVADVSDRMQIVLLQTLYGCWKTNHQMIIILIDKLLKMQVLDCSVVVQWIFSDEMKGETDRQWVWEVLNTSLSRLSRHIAGVVRVVNDLEKQMNNSRAIKEDDDEMNEDGDKQTQDQEKFEEERNKLDTLREFQKNLYLEALHKFTIVLTEHIVTSGENGTEIKTPWFDSMTGRFKQLFLVHYNDLKNFSTSLGNELFRESTVDALVCDIYRQFVSLSR